MFKTLCSHSVGIKTHKKVQWAFRQKRTLWCKTWLMDKVKSTRMSCLLFSHQTGDFYCMSNCCLLPCFVFLYIWKSVIFHCDTVEVMGGIFLFMLQIEQSEIFTCTLDCNALLDECDFHVYGHFHSNEAAWDTFLYYMQMQCQKHKDQY